MLATFHYETGKRLSLNELLTPEDKTAVVMQLMAQLKQSPDAGMYTSGKVRWSSSTKPCATSRCSW